MTSECNYSPLQLWIDGMMTMKNRTSSAVQAVLRGNDFAELHNYGVDEDGPVPRLQTNNNVQIPENGFQPSVRSLHEIHGILSNLDGTQDIGGILAYQLILQVLEIS